MEANFYFDKLYPLQDKVLALLSKLDTGFYLTGGTASARGYLQHRFSDDLDLFVNHDERFQLWAELCIDALAEVGDWRLQVVRKDVRFLRLVLDQNDTSLRVEFINDVPARVGDIRQHPILGRLDSPENILANKVTAALDRAAAKDLADIWGFCTRMGLSLEEAITNAHSKAAGIFAPDLARVLLSATEEDWQQVRWWQGPSVEQFLGDLRVLGERLIYVV